MQLTIAAPIDHIGLFAHPGRTVAGVSEEIACTPLKAIRASLKSGELDDRLNGVIELEQIGRCRLSVIRALKAHQRRVA